VLLNISNNLVQATSECSEQLSKPLIDFHFDELNAQIAYYCRAKDVIESEFTQMRF
jgi:hypothetical protein